MPVEVSVLKERFTGEIITPGDAGYDAEARTFVVKGSPAAIVFPRTPEDVS